MSIKIIGEGFSERELQKFVDRVTASEGKYSEEEYNIYFRHAPLFTELEFVDNIINAIDNHNGLGSDSCHDRPNNVVNKTLLRELRVHQNRLRTRIQNLMWRKISDLEDDKKNSKVKQ